MSEEKSIIQCLFLGPIYSFQGTGRSDGLVSGNGRFSWHLSRNTLYIGKNHLRDSEWAYRVSDSTDWWTNAHCYWSGTYRRVYHPTVYYHCSKHMLLFFFRSLISRMYYLATLTLAESPYNSCYSSSKPNVSNRRLLP